MYEIEDIYSLKLILSKIELIDEIVFDFGSITNALQDKKMGKPSLLMHLISMAEQFNRLKNNNSFELLSKFDKADLKGSYDIRNFIAHDYEGTNLAIVEMIIRTKLPKLKNTVISILEKEQ